MRVSLWKRLVYAYFMYLWRPIFAKDIGILAAHILEFDKMHVRVPSRDVDEDDMHYRED